jgi:hypothetical protein
MAGSLQTRIKKSIYYYYYYYYYYHKTGTINFTISVSSVIRQIFASHHKQHDRIKRGVLAWLGLAYPSLI